MNTMQNKKQIELELVADFAPQLSGREIISVGVGPENEVLVLAATSSAKEEALRRHVHPSGASFPLSKVAYQADVLQFGPDFQGEVALEVEEAYPKIQPLPNGEVLIVAARCYNRSGNPEQNAAVYDVNGVFTRRFVMGDGIGHVQVARDGSIWAGYSDEGVFGNYGWVEPLGASGLVHLDAHGGVIWKFEPSDEVDFIADCYSLNVARDAVWLCPYTDFPVIRLKPGGTKRAWKSEFAGARAITSDNHRVLLFGGYTENRTRCVVQDLGDDSMKNAREVGFLLHSGEKLERPQVRGRGSILHFFVDTSWYQLDLAQHDI